MTNYSFVPTITLLEYSKAMDLYLISFFYNVKMADKFVAC